MRIARQLGLFAFLAACSIVALAMFKSTVAVVKEVRDGIHIPSYPTIPRRTLSTQRCKPDSGK
jgi:hypothetical protein